jgi:predicted nicotinamide N-methyase
MRLAGGRCLVSMPSPHHIPGSATIPYGPRMPPPDPIAFIRAHLPLAPVPGIPELRLHQATPTSGLHQLSRHDAEGFGTPYWAYRWAGGLALARYLLDNPNAVYGRRVLDLGAGSGLVAIAAAKAGAGAVTAAETDPYAIAALGLNLAENGVVATILHADLTVDVPPPGIDLVLVGDLFYDADLAARVAAFLNRCRAAGMEVLIGDPRRAFLPLPNLVLLARYDVAETGHTKESCVFSYS